MKKIIKVIVIILCAISCVFCSYEVITGNQTYFIASRFASVEERDLVLLKYDVYATEESFNKALIEEVDKVVKEYKQEKEFILVKIKGEDKVTRKNDYIIKYDSDFYELNIEYYIIKNVTIFSFSFPCLTFISFIDTIAFVAFIVIIGIDVLIIFVILIKRKHKKHLRANIKNKD